MGVLANMMLVLASQSDWNTGALTEMLAAFGAPVALLTSEDQEELARFAETIYGRVLVMSELERIATEAPLQALQAFVPNARKAAVAILHGLSGAFPRPPADIEDALTAMYTLVQLRIESIEHIA